MEGEALQPRQSGRSTPSPAADHFHDTDCGSHASRLTEWLSDEVRRVYSESNFFPVLAEAEAWCTALARRLGVDAAEAWAERIGNVPMFCLISKGKPSHYFFS